MLVILGVMAAIKGPLAKAEFPVDVLDGALRLVLPHHGDTGFHQVLAESGGLAHEAAHDLLVALAEHGGYHVPFRAEVEEGEEIAGLSDPGMDVRGVDVR